MRTQREGASSLPRPSLEPSTLRRWLRCEARASAIPPSRNWMPGGVLKRLRHTDARNTKLGGANRACLLRGEGLRIRAAEERAQPAPTPSPRQGNQYWHVGRKA